MFAFLLYSDFYWDLGFYAAIVFVEAVGAYREGWLFASQVRSRPNVPKKFLDLWRHWGIQSDFWVINPTIAYLLTMHGSAWNSELFARTLVAVALGSLPVVDGWVKDDVPSALARNGSVTVPGGILHYFYMPLTISPAVMYYIHPAYVAPKEVVIITGILMAHWAVGLLQPPKLVHGKIHQQAWIQTFAGWLVMICAATRLIFFA